MLFESNSKYLILKSRIYIFSAKEERNERMLSFIGIHINRECCCFDSSLRSGIVIG